MRKRFEEQRIPEWEEGYLGYYQLRALVQVLKAHCFRMVKRHFVAGREEYQYILPEDSQTEHLAKVSQSFLRTFFADLHRVNVFTRIRVDGLEQDWKLLVDCSERCSSHSGALYLHKRKGLKYAIEMLLKNLNLLSDFIELNSQLAASLATKYKKYASLLQSTLGPCAIEADYERFRESSFSVQCRPRLQKLREQMLGNYLSRFYHQFSRGLGLEKAKTRLDPTKISSPKELIFIGTYLGSLLLLICLLPLGFAFGVFSIVRIEEEVAPVYRSAALFICYLWGLSANVFVWNKFHVNYRLIFRMGSHFSSFLQIAKRNAFFTAALLIVFTLHVLQASSSIGSIGIEYLPLLFYLVFFGYIFFPSDSVFNPRGRKYFYTLLYNILLSPIGVGQVNFLLTWATDQLVSFAGPLRDLAYTICYYTTQDQKARLAECKIGLNSKTVVTGYVVVLIPLFYRIAQCARLAYASGAFFQHVQFYNLLKYLLSATSVSIAWGFKYQPGLLVPFILVSICSTSYAYYWDMKHDWGFLQPDSKYPFLRSQLSYRNPRFYYSIVLLNLVLRCAWTLTITNVGAYINSDLLVFFVSLLEILRRCLWNFFRVQKEHIANCGQFRTTEDIAGLVKGVDSLNVIRTADVYKLEDVAVVWADLKFDYTIVEKEQIPEFERQFRNLQDADLRQEVSGLVQAYITRFKPRFGQNSTFRKLVQLAKMCEQY